MKVNNAFLPLSEKHVKAKVSLMSWSPKLDLLAIATVSGELILYRLASRERIWSLPANGSNINIVSLSWRPDGKVIAIANNNTKDDIQFVYMEKAEILWKFTSAEQSDKKSVVLIKWFKIDCLELQHPDQSFSSNDFLPTVPELSTYSDKKSHKSMLAIADNDFHALLLADSLVCVTVYANGIFPIARICCNDNFKAAPKILGVQITPNLDTLSVVFTCQSASTAETQSWMFNMEKLTKNIALYNLAAHKAYKILSLKGYLSQILENITEQCDTVTQDVDSQLTRFLVKGNSSDTIGDDFLQLLIWGKPTDSLKNIFTRHLTKKEIKTLGQLIESSYTSMQQNLIVNFQTAVTALYYHLTEIRGMVADDENILPFQATDIEELLTTTGSLLLKSTELLQVIDSSLKNFKAFFRWLYVSMVKIQDEPLDELGNLSGDEVFFVADFIFEHLTPRRPSDSKKGKHFHLEKVCQYLKDEPLSFPIKSNQNEWSNFVAASSILSNCDIILKPQPNTSLKQIFTLLTDQLNCLVSSPKLHQENNCPVLHKVCLLSHSTSPRVKAELWCRTGIETDSSIFLLLSDRDPSAHIARLYHLGSKTCTSLVKALNMNFKEFENESSDDKTSSDLLKISDFDSYDEDNMTFLLQEQSNASISKSYLAQVQLSAVIKRLDDVGVTPDSSSSLSKVFTIPNKIPTIDASEMCSDVRELKSKINGVSVVTSGGRKVSCVLSSDLHHIYPFLMDHTEEDDYIEGDEEE